MQIINLKWGLTGFLFGVIIVITFNQNINEVIGHANTEMKLLLNVTWLALCFLIAGYAPMALTIADDPQGGRTREE